MNPEKNVTYHTRVLVMTALIAALACVATLAIRIPSPTGGYMNLGDTVVLLGAFLLGGAYGAAAGGIGAALADLISGYAVYVPATLVIKALMAAAAALVYRAGGKRAWSIVAAGFAAEAVMILGYWLYDGILARNLIGALAGVPSNLVQAALGIAAGTALTLALRRVSQIRRWFPKL